MKKIESLSTKVYFKILVYLILVISFFSCANTKEAKQINKPENDKANVIWIITDEHNFRTIGAYRDQLPKDQAFVWGDKAYVETPNLDKMARSGVIFNRMYCSAAVCTASRASMMTGMYPMTLGIPNNSNKKGDGKYLKSNVTTIADVLSDAGYITGYSGKWHLSESRTDRGLDKDKNWWSPYPIDNPNDTYGFQDKRFMFNGGHDKWIGVDANGNPYKANHKAIKPLGRNDKYGQPLYTDGKSDNVKFTTDWLTDKTVEFIDAHKEKSFFYVVSIPDPHTPNEVRAPYDTLFDEVEIHLPKTYTQAQAQREEKLPKWQKPDGKSDDKKRLKRDVRQYLGMVKLIDDNIGRIIKKLKDEGIFENTIIMFSSDHGDLLGEHARSNKGTIHEASAKIPCIITQGETGKNPLIPRNKVVNLAANNTDWMPTFLSLLNVDCPKVAGRDISPILNGSRPADWKDITYTRLGHYAAITEHYKLHLAAKEKPWLFDIEADSSERVNFIDDPKYTTIAKKLAKDVKNYMVLAKDNNPKIQKLIDNILTK
ncbi:sulfatase-like hydrolase/transferase [Aquimarina algicola]|uniref:DUF229 domain-containing protein n=1 Tax=Aquimarina algicola TaxID=2589995 RepID=A0A504J721_9FLAO|nr:sulfatase-like hydrolase/transferase [Aquimarina algicola]TPN84405.1 DUF229 domain-containing protein [Aquimarina algicola]